MIGRLLLIHREKDVWENNCYCSDTIMDEELKTLMRRDVEISEESLKILQSMRRAQRLGTIFTAVKWVFIIIITVGSYYIVQPFLEKGLEVFVNPVGLLEPQGQNLFNPGNLNADKIGKIKEILLKGGAL